MDWFKSMFSNDTSPGDVISASTLNVTKIVTFFTAIFAGITQVLTSTNVVGLSTTQMVTIWLVVAGLVVLLAITDMIVRGYVTGKRSVPASVSGLDVPVEVSKQDGGGHLHAAMIEIESVGEQGRFAHIQWNENGHEKDKWVALNDIIPAHPAHN